MTELHTTQTEKVEALRERALSAGEAIVGGANRTITLDDPAIVWFVESGSLDIFAIESDDEDQGDSGLKHVFRAGSGELALPFITNESTLRFVAKGTADARLRRVPVASLFDESVASDLVHCVEAWVTALCDAVTRDITLRPQISRRIDATGEVELSEGAVISARRGVRWLVVRDEEQGAKYLGTESIGGDHPHYAPLTPSAWVNAEQNSNLSVATTLELMNRNELRTAINDFHLLIANAELLNRQLLIADLANAQLATRQHRLADEQSARHGFFSTFRRGMGRMRSSQPEEQDWHSALASALSAVGEWEGISFDGAHEQLSQGQELDDILRATGVRHRRVALVEDERWWQHDNGALLGFLRDSDLPVALLPGWHSGYRMVSAWGARRLKANQARSLHPVAWSFLRALPDDRAVKESDLVRVAKKRLGSDLFRLMLLGLVVGVVMLAPAIVTGIIVNSVIPVGAGGALVQLIALLIALAVVGTLFRILQGSTLLKIEARVALRLDAMIQDRVFKLAPTFIGKFTSGNLATRVRTFRDLRDRLSGTVLHSLLSAVFLLPTFGLLFFYDATIGVLSLILGLFGLVLGAVLGLKQFEPQRRWYAGYRDMSSVLRQFFRGIGKLRTSGAQASAYAIWAQRYREQQQAFLDIGNYDHHLVALGVSAPAFAGAMLMGAGWLLFEGRTGDFLVIYSASMVFYLAVMRLGDTFASLAGVWPGVSQVRPLLAEVPDPHLVVASTSENSNERLTAASQLHLGGPFSGRVNLGSAHSEIGMRGELQLQHVSWGYEDGPLILNDVSVHARPGQFIAIVGESGAGKSTLLRLALGLARPISGSVSYDGRDIERMDAVAIRRNIGVVLQDGDLPEGPIEEAITGVASSLTVEDAWRAARIAAVSDDIEAMPMGMHTVIGPNSTSLSGGQVQRIQIAAALVRNPRILFLDEATNWLDNRNQAKVMRNIDNLDITRVVVAHRLSTIRNADQIFVLQAGKIVQQGTFAELVEVPGTFQDLAQRQMN